MSQSDPLLNEFKDLLQTVAEEVGKGAVLPVMEASQAKWTTDLAQLQQHLDADQKQSIAAFTEAVRRLDEASLSYQASARDAAQALQATCAASQPALGSVLDGLTGLQHKLDASSASLAQAEQRSASQLEEWLARIEQLGSKHADSVSGFVAQLDERTRQLTEVAAQNQRILKELQASGSQFQQAAANASKELQRLSEQMLAAHAQASQRLNETAESMGREASASAARLQSIADRADEVQRSFAGSAEQHAAALREQHAQTQQLLAEARSAFEESQRPVIANLSPRGALLALLVGNLLVLGCVVASLLLR